MTNQKILLIIEKLSRLTVARGATEAEAAVAREKIVSLRAQLNTESSFTSSRYEPKTAKEYKEYPDIMWKPLTPAQMKEWNELVDKIYRKNHQPPPPRK